MEISLVGAEFFHVDERSDGQIWQANKRISQFCERS
jgi:hypothetical protein